MSTATISHGNGPLSNALKGLKQFTGENPALFEAWHEKTSLMISVSRPDIYEVMEGQTRPAEDDDDTSSTSTLRERQAAYDRARYDLYVILMTVTEQPATSLVRKHKEDNSTRGDGQKAWKELTAKYLEVTDETIRLKAAQLLSTKMKPGQGPDHYFLQSPLLRAEVAKMGEPMSDRRFKDILVQGLTDEYAEIKVLTYRDRSFNLADMQRTMSHMYMDQVAHKNANDISIAGRGAAMLADLKATCYNCGKTGHFKRSCPALNGKEDKKPAAAKGKGGGGRGQKWCSVHQSTTHNDIDCRKQGAPKATPADGGTQKKWCSVHKTASHSDAECYKQGAARPQKSRGAYTICKDANGDAEEDSDFDGGCMWMAATAGRTFPASSSDLTMLVDSGATEHFIDDELIPRFKNFVRKYTSLKEPRKITTAGKQTLLGKATAILPGTITDNNGSTHAVGFPCLVVSGLGRHLFSSTKAASRGIATVIEAGNPHLKRNDIIVPLQQLEEDMGLCSFQVKLGTEVNAQTASSTPALALAAQVSADVWHRRLGHMNPRSMEILRRQEGNGVDYSGTMASCDTCALGKSQQKAHPKKTAGKTSAPMELVYTDLMGPIHPAAKGGFLYVSKFTDDYSRMKEIFLLKSKNEAAESLRLYNQTVSIPLGLRVQRLRADKGGEYKAKNFQKLCNDTGISLEYAATATPQQNGVSERDGKTIATIARCLLKDGNFPRTLWGEMFFTAVYLSNRSLHKALDGATPYFKMYDKEADLSGLRATGARAFVHIETHTSKLDDKAREGKLCGFSMNSKTYRIYNPAKGTVVESRNVTFLETPAYNLPEAPAELEDDYVQDVIDYNSFLLPVSNYSGGASAKKLEELSALIKDMLRNNAAQAAGNGVAGGASSPGIAGGASSPGVAGGASSPGVAGGASSPGVAPADLPGASPAASPEPAPAPRELRVTRASTRANPRQPQL